MRAIYLLCAMYLILREANAGLCFNCSDIAGTENCNGFMSHYGYCNWSNNQCILDTDFCAKINSTCNDPLCRRDKNGNCFQYNASLPCSSYTVHDQCWYSKSRCVWTYSKSTCSDPYQVTDCSDVDNLIVIYSCYYNSQTSKFEFFDNSKPCSTYNSNQEQCEKASAGCIYNTTSDSNQCISYNPSLNCSQYTNSLTCMGFKYGGTTQFGRCFWAKQQCWDSMGNRQMPCQNYTDQRGCLSSNSGCQWIVWNENGKQEVGGPLPPIQQYHYQDPVGFGGFTYYVGSPNLQMERNTTQLVYIPDSFYSHTSGTCVKDDCSLYSTTTGCSRPYAQNDPLTVIPCKWNGVMCVKGDPSDLPYYQCMSQDFSRSYFTWDGSTCRTCNGQIPQEYITQNFGSSYIYNSMSNNYLGSVLFLAFVLAIQ